MSNELAWTVKRILEWSHKYFDDKGIDSVKMTSELLLSHALSCTRMDLYFRYEQPLLPEELARYKSLVKRRAQHEPTQYILGEWEFWSLPIKVDQRVLIPRTDTEVLVEAALKAVEEYIPSNGVFLDLCTGSGAIACALAKECPDAVIHATDLSSDALDVARSNVENLEFQKQITLFEGNLFEPLPPQSYDMIVSNPPYITCAEMEELQPEVRLFEPHLALYGGEDGLDIVRQILTEIPTRLAPGGLIAIEFGASQGAAMQTLAEQTGFFSSVSIIKDFGRRDRVLLAQRNYVDSH